MTTALMVTSSFLPGRGGIETYLAELCAEVAPAVAVLAPRRRDRTHIPEGLWYPVIGHPGPMLVPTPRLARVVVDHAHRLGTDRVLFGTPWPLALLGPRLARAGLRYAAIVHGAELLVPGAVPILTAKLARALAGADLLLPVSRFTAAALRSLIEDRGPPVPNIDVLRARVDLDRFRPDADTGGIRRRMGVDDGAHIVLVFGRLVRRKGVHRLIDALPDLRRRVPDTLVVVAGTGPRERALRARARRSPARVVFAGRVADADAPALYATADVFALPVADRFFGLDVEGLGVVLLEASACETPCVTGRSGGTAEAVVDGTTGFVIDATDRAELVDRISTLLEDRERARAMGRAARAHVAHEFSHRRLPPRLLDWLGLSPQGDGGAGRVR